MGKIDIFKYEEQRLKNVIALINNKIKYNEELFNKQKRQGLMSLYATQMNWKNLKVKKCLQNNA